MNSKSLNEYMFRSKLFTFKASFEKSKVKKKG